MSADDNLVTAKSINSHLIPTIHEEDAPEEGNSQHHSHAEAEHGEGTGAGDGGCRGGGQKGAAIHVEVPGGRAGAILPARRLDS